MIDQALLDILVCPENRTPLRWADEKLLARLNQAIAEGKVDNQGAQPVREPLAAGLIDQEATWLYPVVDDIPVLLIDESIPLNQLEAPLEK